MSILTGTEILNRMKKGDISIKPFNKEQLNPNSYNLRLHNELYTYKHPSLDIRRENEVEKLIIPENGLWLHPGKLYLGRTIEYTKTKNLVAILDGRSSTGRLGLNIHITAGFGDIGFEGYWTLEISCIQPVCIYPDIEIGQIYYNTIEGKPDIQYDGKYNHNKGVQASMMYKDFEKKE